MLRFTPSTTPVRTFEDHEDIVKADAVFPDRRRMVTGSSDTTLRLWDLEKGVVLKKKQRSVRAVAVFPDRLRMVTGSFDQKLRL
jgi:WD40 repeat protein